MVDVKNEDKPEETSEKMERLERLLIDCVIWDIEKEDLTKATEHMKLLTSLLDTKINLMKSYQEMQN